MMVSLKKFDERPVLAVLCFAMAAGMFWHFHPGAMSPDSFTILAQARSGVWEDGAPPFMAAIWGILDRAWPGPAGLLMLNLLLFYGGLFLVFCALSARHARTWPWLVLLGLFPPIVGILGAIWTDVMMAAFFSAGIGLFLVSTNCKDHLRNVSGCVALLLLACGAAVRHNGAAAMLPLIVTGLYLVRLRTDAYPAIMRRVVGSIVMGSLLALMIFGLNNMMSRRLVDTHRYFWRVAAVYDIAGASYESQRDLFSPELFPNNSLSDINALYSPRSVTPLVTGEQVHLLPGETPRSGRPFDPALLPMATNPMLLLNWRNVILQHPAAFLKHRWHVFHSLITRSPWGLWAPVFDAIYANDMGVKPRDSVPGIYFDKVKSLAYHSRVFEPCWYLLIAALMVIPCYLMGLRRGNPMLLASAGLFASGLLHMMSLYFLAASADYRFSHWLVTSTSLGCIILVLERRKIAKKTKVAPILPSHSVHPV